MLVVVVMLVKIIMEAVVEGGGEVGNETCGVGGGGEVGNE